MPPEQPEVHPTIDETGAVLSVSARTGTARARGASRAGPGPGEGTGPVRRCGRPRWPARPRRDLSGQAYAVAGGLVVDVFEKSHPARCCGGADGVGLGAAAVVDGHDVGGRLSRETLIKADQDDAVGGLEAEQVRGGGDEAGRAGERTGDAAVIAGSFGSFGVWVPVPMWGGGGDAVLSAPTLRQPRWEEGAPSTQPAQ